MFHLVKYSTNRDQNLQSAFDADDLTQHLRASDESLRFGASIWNNNRFASWGGEPMGATEATYNIGIEIEILTIALLLL